MNELEIRSAFVAMCKTFLGLSESDGSHKKVLDIYNSISPLPRSYKMTTKDPWCAAYASAMAKKAGYLDIIPAECSCSKMIEKWKKLGRWEESDNYTPTIGDYMYYDFQGKENTDSDAQSTVDHVGIVTAVSGKTITVIEGNYSDSVKERKISVGHAYICGYGLPNYATKSDITSPSSLGVVTTANNIVKVSVQLRQVRQGNTGVAVKALQSILNGANPFLSVDGEFGPKTLAAVKDFQTKNKLEVDGVVGPLTWSKLING